MASSLLIWLAVVSLLGWLHFPLCFRVARRLRDRGLGLSKIAGVFLPTYVSWLICHGPVTHTRTSILAVVAVLAVINGLFVWYDRRAYGTFFRRRWKFVLTLEAVFWLGGLGAALIRSQIPAITYDIQWWGAEKWSDFTLLSALTRQVHFPPIDPWFAGHTTNYYYFGHLVWATLTKVTALPPEITYNLSLATIVALALTLCTSLGYHLFRSLGLGLLLAGLVVLGGNLKPAAQILANGRAAREFAAWFYFAKPPTTRNPQELLISLDAGDNLFWSSGDLWDMFWRSSREMYYGPQGLAYPAEPEINEFPSFSFILGDLHPHFSAHPLFLAFLLILAALWRTSQRRTFEGHKVLLDRLPLWLGLALVAGLLYATNSWDCFVALFVAAVALPFARGFRDWPAGARVIFGLFVLGLGYIVGTRFFCLPFDRFFVPPKTPGLAIESLWPPNIQVDSPVGWVPPELRSTTSQWLLYFGLFILPYLGWLAAEAVARTPRVAIEKRTAWLSVALAVAVFATCEARSRFLGLHVFVLLAIAPVAFQQRRRDGLELVAILAWTALLVSLLCELFHYDDNFAGANERINTVFKVYYCLWPITALAAVGACSALWGGRGIAPKPPASSLSPLTARRALACLLMFLLAATSALYPLFAWTIRLTEYKQSLPGLGAEPTLDGLKYLESMPDRADDLRAGLWLRENASPYAVVAEACDWGYSGAGRFAAVGGVTSLLGWYQHEENWRAGSNAAAVAQRRSTIDDLFTTTSLEAAVEILMDNRVEYVAVGALERKQYDKAGLEKFNILGDVVFRSGDTILYDVGSRLARAAVAAEEFLRQIPTDTSARQDGRPTPDDEKD